MPKSPEKPGDLNMQNLKYLRFVDPEDSTKIIQIALEDTGAVTADGTRIYTLGVSAGGGAPLPIATQRPNAQTSGSLTMNNTLLPLPTTTDAMYVLLKAASTNAVDILLWNNTPLEPGESVVIETDVDAAWIRAQAASGTLYYTILRRI